MEGKLRPIRLAKIDVKVYRAPIEQPVATAFGRMTDRPAVIVEAVEEDGTVGYGEIWSNFPSCGAEHRARLALTACVPLLLYREWDKPETAFQHLTGKLRTLAVQAGEPGPIAQAIAGIDTALWDIAAKREEKPLWRFLGGEGDGSMRAYASGINPTGTVEQALKAVSLGYRAFKLKIGFGRERDLANIEALREVLGEDAPIMVDANQAWNLEEAKTMSRALAEFHPTWLEEPLPADSALDDWKQLRDVSPIPLAGGENIRGDAAFQKIIDAGVFAVIQPDLAKWGGISACLPLARRIHQSGARYCPHYLGGGIGLLASAHLLAAVGGDGSLEMDCNDNPLREGLAQPFPRLVDGKFVLAETPGLGVAPDPTMSCYALPVLA